jgi:hypothetical protein
MILFSASNNHQSSSRSHWLGVVGQSAGWADGGFGWGAVCCRRHGLSEDGVQRRGVGEVEHVLERIGKFIAQGEVLSGAAG